MTAIDAAGLFGEAGGPVANGKDRKDPGFDELLEGLDWMRLS